MKKLWLIADRLEDIRMEFYIRIKDGSGMVKEVMAKLGYETQEEIDEFLRLSQNFAHVRALCCINEKIKDRKEKIKALQCLFGTSVENLISDFEI